MDYIGVSLFFWLCFNRAVGFVRYRGCRERASHNVATFKKILILALVS